VNASILTRLAVVARWVTFDCYGTLIDWICSELARVFGGGRADECVRRYHELEPELESDGTLIYREAMTEAMDGSAPRLAASGLRRGRRQRTRGADCR
jgi:FMN phosphatase YigB (HAD superfamily)